jgi:hypothetical protein
LGTEDSDLSSLKESLIACLAEQQCNVNETQLMVFWQNYWQSIPQSFEQHIAVVAKKIPFEQWLSQYA